MPEAPAAMPVLSTTRTSAPLPRPFALSASARWYALLKPCTPAPITKYFTPVGSAIPAPLASRRARCRDPRSDRIGYDRTILEHPRRSFKPIFRQRPKLVCIGTAHTILSRSGKVPDHGCETAAHGGARGGRDRCPAARSHSQRRARAWAAL